MGDVIRLDPFQTITAFSWGSDNLIRNPRLTGVPGVDGLPPHWDAAPLTFDSLEVVSTRSYAYELLPQPVKYYELQLTPTRYRDYYLGCLCGNYGGEGAPDFSVSRIEFRETVGGEDLCSGGVPSWSASSTPGEGNVAYYVDKLKGYQARLGSTFPLMAQVTKSIDFTTFTSPIRFTSSELTPVIGWWLPGQSGYCVGVPAGDPSKFIHGYLIKDWPFTDPPTYTLNVYGVNHFEAGAFGAWLFYQMPPCTGGVSLDISRAFTGSASTEMEECFASRMPASSATFRLRYAMPSAVSISEVAFSAGADRPNRYPVAGGPNPTLRVTRADFYGYVAGYGTTNGNRLPFAFESGALHRTEGGSGSLYVPGQTKTDRVHPIPHHMIYDAPSLWNYRYLQPVRREGQDGREQTPTFTVASGVARATFLSEGEFLERDWWGADFYCATSFLAGTRSLQAGENYLFTCQIRVSTTPAWEPEEEAWAEPYFGIRLIQGDGVETGDRWIREYGAGWSWDCGVWESAALEVVSPFDGAGVLQLGALFIGDPSVIYADGTPYYPVSAHLDQRIAFHIEIRNPSLVRKTEPPPP